MRFGVVTGFGPRAEGPAVADLVETVEGLGYDSLWLTEHLVVPEVYESPYPYAVSGDMPIGVGADLPEPLTWLAFAAARTSRVLLGTSCVIVPERNTLDLRAGGRLRLGVGLGWCREEAEAVGTTWADRAPRTEAAVEALRRLWTGEPVAYEGPGVAFPPVVCRPTPAGPTIPIVVCGPSVHAADRAGRIGDGFFTNHRDPDVLQGLVDAVRRAAEGAGRDPEAIEITAGASPSPRTVDRLAAMGVNRMVWPVPTRDPARVTRQLTRAARAVM
jgi:probable F420-dependent oxidoreductase